MFLSFHQHHIAFNDSEIMWHFFEYFILFLSLLFGSVFPQCRQWIINIYQPLFTVHCSRHQMHFNSPTLLYCEIKLLNRNFKNSQKNCITLGLLHQVKSFLTFSRFSRRTLKHSLWIIDILSEIFTKYSTKVWKQINANGKWTNIARFMRSFRYYLRLKFETFNYSKWQNWNAPIIFRWKGAVLNQSKEGVRAVALVYQSSPL